MLLHIFWIFFWVYSSLGNPNTINENEQISKVSSKDLPTSFGIRSFTIDVTTPTEKPTVVTYSKNKTNLIKTNLENIKITSSTIQTDMSNTELEILPLTTVKSIPIEDTSSVQTTLPPLLLLVNEDITSVSNKENIEHENTDERPPISSVNIPVSIATTNNHDDEDINVETTTEEIMINDIHVEKKLDNGLYRIKLAEIITDEFGGNSPDQEEQNNHHHEEKHEPQKTNSIGGKINIIDLYPLKLEDFSPIIKDSNEKIIRDKQVYFNNDNNLSPNSLNDIFDDDSNIPTSKIEIELIDENTNSQKNKFDSFEKNYKFTNYNLQEQDNVESKFTTVLPKTVNHKIEFIDRRVKKSYNPPLNRKSINIDDIEFANTKFNTSNTGSQKNLKDNQNNQNEKPEFSTTKFYNSKELYNEMLHRKLTSEGTTGGTTSLPFETTTMKPKNFKTLGFHNINEELLTYSSTTLNSESSVSKKFNSVTTPTNLSSDEHVSSSSSSTISTEGVTQKYNDIQSTHTTTKIIKFPSNDNIPKAIESKVTQPTKIRPTGKLKSLKNIIKELIPSKPKILTILSSSSGSIATTEPSSSTEYPVSEMSNSKRYKISSIPTIETTNINRLNEENVTPTINHVVTKSSSVMETTSSSSSSSGKLSGMASTVTTTTVRKPFSRPRVLTRLQEKINSLECDIQNVPQDSHLWRGNETHELLLPITIPENCKTTEDCLPMIISWEGQAEIQSGDVLLVEINDSLLTSMDFNQTHYNAHKATTTVYQVTRPGHEHCDVTEGVLLDITPLVVDGKKLVTLYDKDLTEGINLLIVVSELWGSQCVRLKVIVKSDNCGENADCSGKGVCFSNSSMEGYECQCCGGFAGPHCEEIDACSPSPCTNNGICVDLSQGHEGNAYQCLCPYGYTGKNCQYESDPCNPIECLNGGSCVGNSTHFRCDCAPGYSGPLCQHNLNECESSPCVHGICVDQEDGFRCFCQPGFAGELCNFEYNECESNPCLNGGQCNDQIGGYECKCTKGYTGKRCHIKVDFCANEPCPEGHKCIDRGDNFACECPGGRNGPDCNQVPRTLCNVNPCANGGTCWTSEESFYCACRPGYTGKICEDEFVVETVVSSSEFMVDDTSARNGFNDKTFGVNVAKSPIELHNAYIAAGTLAAAIFIVAIVVTICHCKVHQTYRRFSTKHHQLIPIFGFGRRTKSPKSHRHWLSGKNGTGGGTQCHNHHVGGRSSIHHPHQVHERPFQRHLAMNLENDMYYTVDFSDSQHSPLIQ